MLSLVLVFTSVLAVGSPGHRKLPLTESGGFDCETGYCEGGKCYVDDVDPDDFDECDEYYCGNDPYWRYDAGDKGPLGCDDIAAEPEKIEKRCRTQERVGVDATGREVRASVACKGVCRESCEGC